MSNLQARDALQRAQQAFLERPGVARKANAPANAVWRDGLRCDISGPAGENASTDMPRAIGGEASAQILAGCCEPPWHRAPLP